MVPFSDIPVWKYSSFCLAIQFRNKNCIFYLWTLFTDSKEGIKIKEQYMNMLTFCWIKYMNRSFVSKTKYMIGVGFKNLARTPIPKLPQNYTPSQDHLQEVNILVMAPKHSICCKCICLCKQIKMRVKLWIFSYPSFNIYFGCSKEPSQWDGSFEYPQHMFSWETRK